MFWFGNYKFASGKWSEHTCHVKIIVCSPRLKCKKTNSIVWQGRPEGGENNSSFHGGHGCVGFPMLLGAAAILFDLPIVAT